MQHGQSVTQWALRNSLPAFVCFLRLMHNVAAIALILSASNPQAFIMPILEFAGSAATRRCHRTLRSAEQLPARATCYTLVVARCAALLLLYTDSNTYSTLSPTLYTARRIQGELPACLTSLRPTLDLLHLAKPCLGPAPRSSRTVLPLYTLPLETCLAHFQTGVLAA